MPVLDISIERLRKEIPVGWGWRPVVVPCGALLVLDAGGNVANRLIRPRDFDSQLVFAVIGNVVLLGLLAVASWFAGRDVAARVGGWGRAFGWHRFVNRDIRLATAGVGIALLFRIIVVGIANAFTHGRAAQQAQNVHQHNTSIAFALLLVLVTVLFAPPIEELIFRGMLLRTFMYYGTFWPAALMSSAIFATFHIYEVHTLVGALTLSISVGGMGLINSVLVRLTDRLAPAVLVHGTLNAFASITIIAQAH